MYSALRIRPLAEADSAPAKGEGRGAERGDDKNSGRGAQFFGRTADFAEHILNRDDPVPNTDVPLSYCYTYDVTASAERKTFPDPVKTGDGVQDFIFQSLKYHNWPLEWYARHSETLLDSQGRVRHLCSRGSGFSLFPRPNAAVRQP